MPSMHTSGTLLECQSPRLLKRHALPSNPWCRIISSIHLASLSYWTKKSTPSGTCTHIYIVALRFNKCHWVWPHIVYQCMLSTHKLPLTILIMRLFQSLVIIYFRSYCLGSLVSAQVEIQLCVVALWEVWVHAPCWWLSSAALDVGEVAVQVVQ